MTEVLRIIKELQSTNSRIEKERILMENKNNQLLKDILYFVYNPFIVTGISKKKMGKVFITTGDLSRRTFSNINEMMRYLEVNNTGKDINVEEVQHYISTLSTEVKDFVTQIAIKDLSIGCDSKTLNKVFGDDFIPVFDVMLAKSYWDHDDKVTDDFIITQKLDGNRCVLIKENGNIKLFTRQGQLYEGLIDIETEAQQLTDNFVYDGELIATNEEHLNSADLYRKTTKIVRKDGIKQGVVFHVFDMIPLCDFKKGICKANCYDRKMELHILLSFPEVFENQWIKEVPMLYRGNDKSQIIYWLDKMIAEGHEGIMVNLANAGYSCKRTSDILKVKKFKDADVKVLGVIEGTGQNIGKLGAITIQFEHKGNLHECNCGSGFSQEERDLYWKNPDLIVGKIVTIGYFEISENQQGGFGLRFPTWKAIIRDDKTEISMN